MKKFLGLTYLCISLAACDAPKTPAIATPPPPSVAADNALTEQEKKTVGNYFLTAKRSMAGATMAKRLSEKIGK